MLIQSMIFCTELGIDGPERPPQEVLPKELLNDSAREQPLVWKENIGYYYLWRFRVWVWGHIGDLS